MCCEVTITLFGSSSSLQPNSIFLSHCSSINFQPPTSQQYFSLTPLQPPAPAPAQRTEWIQNTSNGASWLYIVWNFLDTRNYNLWRDFYIFIEKMICIEYFPNFYTQMFLEATAIGEINEYWHEAGFCFREWRTECEETLPRWVLSAEVVLLQL